MRSAKWNECLDCAGGEQLNAYDAIGSIIVSRQYVSSFGLSLLSLSVLLSWSPGHDGAPSRHG